MLWPVAEPEDTNIPGIDRLLALTDGVVAIALTLLVLQLQVPASSMVAHANSAKDLWHALNIDGSELTSYLVSFVIIPQFWLVHHRAMRNMRGHSEGLAWRNFGFLLALTLMPFTSDLIGRFGSNPVAITLFALNLALISLASQWIVLYAAQHRLVEDKHRSPHEELAARIRVVLVLCHHRALHHLGLDRGRGGQVRLAAVPVDDARCGAPEPAGRAQGQGREDPGDLTAGIRRETATISCSYSSWLTRSQLRRPHHHRPWRAPDRPSSLSAPNRIGSPWRRPRWCAPARLDAGLDQGACVAIRAVMFDFGGVISSSPFDAFSRLEEEQGLPAGFIRTVNATNPDDNAWARLERSEVDLDTFAVLWSEEARALGHDLDGRAGARTPGRPDQAGDGGGHPRPAGRRTRRRA